MWMLVGTYTGGGSEGIYVYGYDSESGRAELVDSVRMSNPSYLMVDGDSVFAVSESGAESEVRSFRFDGSAGRLTDGRLIGRTGADPCNVASNGTLVVTANYSGGDVSVFGKDGLRQTLGLEERSRSHLHCVKFSPDGKYLFAADLGRDAILRWRLRGGAVDESSLRVFELPEGSGPRHFVFDRGGRNVYLINEVGGTVMRLSYRGGELTLRQTILADDAGGHGSADIVLTPDGRYLYASNRLKGDGVAIFAVAADGSLSRAGYQTTGIHPRNLNISPDGRFLTVAARDSGTIQFYRIAPDTGLLTPHNEPLRLDKPVCVTFVK